MITIIIFLIAQLKKLGALADNEIIDEVANRGDVYNVDNLRVNTILTYTGDL